MLSTFLKDGKLVDFLTGPGIHAQEKKRIDLENELKTLHHINQYKKLIIIIIKQLVKVNQKFKPKK